MKEYEYKPVLMPDKFFIPDVEKEMQEKAAMALRESIQKITKEQELTIRGFFEDAGYKFETDVEYYRFLQDHCTMVIKDDVTEIYIRWIQDPIVSWSQKSEFEFSGSECRWTFSLIPQIK